MTYPSEYKKFVEVKEVVAKYARNRQEKRKISERLYELTGKKDDSGVPMGYRTRIVHMGQKIEQIVPNVDERKQLFNELHGYLRMLIDHMKAHSDLSWNDYQAVVKQLL